MNMKKKRTPSPFDERNRRKGRLNLRMDPELVEEIHNYANLRKITLAELAEMAFHDYLKGEVGR